jgi:hypothetical protein
LATLAVAVGSALLARGPPELRPWRIGLFAVAAYWIVAASFSPLGQVFPDLIVWFWAGILLGGGSGWTAQPDRVSSLPVRQPAR